MIQHRIGRALLGVLLAGSVIVAGAAPATAAPSDKEIARAGVLVRADFPSDWTSSTRGQTSDAALDAAAGQVESCRPFLAFSRANRKKPRAKSPNFEHEQSNVTNTVSVYPSNAKASAALHMLSDPGLPDCLERLFSSVFEQQLAKQSDVAGQIISVNTSIAPVTDVRIGDEAVAYQGTVDIAMKDGTTQTIGLGIVSSRVGAAVAGYSWTSDTDISAMLQPAIVKSVNRLQRTQSAD
jgi:hypothetical protein